MESKKIKVTQSSQNPLKNKFKSLGFDVVKDIPNDEKVSVIFLKRRN
jgi:hypothetical protein